MASFNRVILMGNLTRDPELRHIPSGSAVCELGLAVNRSWTDKNSSEKREEVTYVDITLWGKQAEIAQKYLTKGAGVLIEGRLQMDEWTDKTSGQKRSKLKVVGELMQMLPRGNNSGGGEYSGPSSSNSSSSSSSHSSRSNQSAPASDPATSFYDDGDGDEGVPF